MSRETKIKVAGFGGQGVMMFGQMLAYSATHDNLNTLWFPSYGPETRGGTANCSIIVSKETINSPVFKNATHLVAFNLPSLEKFKNEIEAAGLLLYNSSLIKQKPKVENVTVVGVPINDIALELGVQQVANMVMLGSYLELTGLFEDETIHEIIKKFMGERKAHMVDINIKAIQNGREFIRKTGVTYAKTS